MKHVTHDEDMVPIVRMSEEDRVQFRHVNGIDSIYNDEVVTRFASARVLPESLRKQQCLIVCRNIKRHVLHLIRDYRNDLFDKDLPIDVRSADDSSVSMWWLPQYD